ncbi:MAG: hydrogenase iron-sulfur subunit, partial [Burkholderiales bacterium]|nr:hydrogenase iron-sulfur subunit [Burkholderiales bacterium]
VDLEFIFRAFAQKADGVFIGGCHLNDCHYNPEGNYDALGNSLIAKRILANIGINPDRLRLEWVSAGEGTRFAEVMIELSAKIKSLGPFGSSEGKPIAELQAGLQAATDLVPYIKLVERERFRVQERKEESYHKLFGSAEFDKLFQELILDKLAMGRIMGLARSQAVATGEIAAGLGLPDADVLRHLNVMAQRGLVKLEGNQVQAVAVA